VSRCRILQCGGLSGRQRDTIALMDGCQLRQDCFAPGQTTYGIRRIIDVLAPEVSHLYCAIHKPFLIYDSLTEEQCSQLDGLYSKLLLEKSQERDLRLFSPGFLLRFRDHIYGDWTDICLLTSRIPLSEISPDRSEVPHECEVFISCIDAAYWEVFARHKSILDRIGEEFPKAVPCKLQNKTV